MEKNKLAIIAGPTASGKSALGARLALRIGGEVISADSMQVYRGMDIGSAKVTEEETLGVPHHLIDVLEPTEDFNVSVFKELSEKALKEIYGSGKVPVLVGGTGFYIQALAYDIDFNEGEADEELRLRLEQEARERGAGHMHDRLREVDPDYALATPAGNLKRVIRALEYYELTGEKFSVRNSRQAERTSPYELFYFVLELPREILYERINKRVDKMMEAGLLSEVEELKAKGCTPQMTSMQGLGYKQLLRHLNGETGLKQAVEDIKKETRHFAKRQLTWFKREKNVIWIRKTEFASDEKIIYFMVEKIDGKQV